MAEYFISNSRYNGSPDGSQSNPFISLVAAQEATGWQGFWLSDNTFRLWADDTFDDRINLPDKPNLGSNFIIEPWTDITNDSKRPIMTRAKRTFNWTFDATNGVWVSEALSHIRYGGCILEDDEPMIWRLWQTNRATTTASMVAGEASFDNLTLQYLIKPRSGTPADHIYAACAGISQIKLSRANRFRISAIAFHLSSQGVAIGGGGPEQSRGGWVIEDCEFAYMGGSVDTVDGVALGNGLGISNNINTYGTSYVNRCTYRDIFDSGVSPQQWENTIVDGGTTYLTIIQDIEFLNNVAERCGLAGYEVSLTSQSGTYTNLIERVNIRKSIARNCGMGWSGNRYGSTGNGFTYLTNDSSPNSIVRDSVMDRCEAYNNVGKGYCLFHTSGNIEVFRSTARNCSVGIMQTSRVGFGQPVSHKAYDNLVENCGTGLEFGSFESGRSGSLLHARNNIVRTCTIGINNRTVAGENSVAEHNTVVNCGTAIRNVGAGTFTKTKNYLHGNTANYSGVTQGSDVMLASAPTVEVNDYGLTSANVASYYFNKDDVTTVVRNGFIWEGTPNNYTIPAGETEKGLEFFWEGSPDPTTDNMFERRFEFNPLEKFYLRKRFYVPTNYYHRGTLRVTVAGDLSSWAVGDFIIAADGTSTANVYYISGNDVWLLFAQNNLYGNGVWTGDITNVSRGQIRSSTRFGNENPGQKFMALWCDDYSAAGQGPSIAIGLQPDGKGGSTLDYTFGADGNAVGVNIPNAHAELGEFIRMEDRGKWFDFIIQMEMASSETAEDGIIEIWFKREGESSYTRMIKQTNAKIGPRAASGNALFQNGYLFGYWSGGVEDDTYIHVSEVELFDDKPFTISPGNKLILNDRRAGLTSRVAVDTPVQVIVVENGTPDKVEVYNTVVTSDNKVRFTNREWAVGDIKEAVIIAGSISQSIIFSVDDV